jgi:hypothetical protein
VTDEGLVRRTLLLVERDTDSFDENRGSETVTIRFKCPDCGCPFQLPDDAAGKRLTCADCGRALDVPVMGSIVRFVGRFFGDGLAGAPLLLGRFALFFCWVPILGVMMAVPLGVLGGVLGVLGLPVGVLRNRQTMMRSLGGIALCVLAIVGSFVSTGLLIVYLNNAANRAGPRQQQVAPVSAPIRPGPHDNRVMTIDGRRADAPPQPAPSKGPLPAKATERKASGEK